MDGPDGTFNDFVGRLSATEAAEQARDQGVRARFAEATGHPRGPALAGAEVAVWRRLEAAAAPDHRAADVLAAEAIDRFCAGDADTRARLIDALQQTRYMRWRVGWVSGGAIGEIARGGAAAERSLGRGVAGIVLGFGDYRDAIVALDRLCLAALRSGLDPFEAIRSTMSSLRDGGPSTPAMQTLARYLDLDRQAALRQAASRPRPD